jgi:hypothetical protein
MTGKIPKTSQLYYFLMPEETTKVLAFIKDQKCSLYATRSRFLSPEPIKYDPTSIPSKLFICPEGFSNEIDVIYQNPIILFAEILVIRFGAVF